MGKKRNVRKFLCGLLMVAIVLTCFQPQTVQAETHYTKAKLTKMINKTKKEVVAAKKKWNSEKRTYQAQTKGATLIFGNVVSNNPLIIKNGLNNSLYWMTDKKYLTIQGIVVGWVKPTGGYQYYNGYPCAVAKSVKVSVADPDTNKKKYEAKADKLESLKEAIKNYAKFDKKKQTVYVGKKTKLGYSWHYVEKYNNKKNIKLSYDKSMIKVTYTNYYVYVTPLKEGTTKLTLSNELVNKKSTITLNIVEKKNTDNTDDEYTEDDDYDDDDDSYIDDNNNSDNNEDNNNNYSDNNDYSDDNDYWDDYDDDDTY